MKTQIFTKEKTDLDLSDECSSYGVLLGALICGIIGIWGVACFLGALVSSGPVAMVRGYISALSGM